MLWLPGNAEFDIAEDLAVFHHGERGRALEIADVGGGVVGILPAVGNRVVAAGADFVGHRIFGAIDQLAAGLIGERGEDLADVVEVPIEIEVLGLDVEDHRVLRLIERERAVAFIAFRDHELAFLGPLGVGCRGSGFPRRRSGWVSGRPRAGRGRSSTEVVVLPWVPEMTMPLRVWRMAARHSARRSSGILRRDGGGIGRVFRADGRGIHDQIRALDGLRGVRRGKHQARRPACARFPRW